MNKPANYYANATDGNELLKPSDFGPEPPESTPTHQRYEPHHDQVWDADLSQFLPLYQAVERMNGMDLDLQKMHDALSQHRLLRDNDTILGAVLRLISTTQPALDTPTRLTHPSASSSSTQDSPP